MTSPTPFDHSTRDTTFDEGLEKVLTGDISGLNDIDPELHETVLDVIGLAQTAGWIGQNQPGLLTPFAEATGSERRGEAGSNFDTAKFPGGRVLFKPANLEMRPKEVMMPHASAAPTPPISQRSVRSRPMHSGTGRRWLDVAIAAALFIAMLGGSFWYADIRTGDNGPSGPQATHFAARPLSSTPASVAQEPVGGDPGNTLSFPAGFDLSAEHDVVPLGDEGPASPQYAAISGDILVVSGTTPEWTSLDNPGLTAIDLTTRKVIWSSELHPLREFVASGSRVFGAFAETDTSTYAMTSISIETGKVLWAGDPLVDNSELDVASPIDARYGYRPVVIEDAIYYVNQEGQIVARDAFRGDFLWFTPLQQTVADPGTGHGSIVGDDQYIYAVDRQNAIRKLDRFTGDEIARFPITDRPASAFVMELHLRDDMLVAVSRTGDLEPATSFVDVISTDDGEVLWSHRLGTVSAYITLTRDLVAIPHYVGEDEVGTIFGDIDEPGRYVSVFDLRSGDPVSLHGPSAAAFSSASSSGSVVCINEEIAISCVDTTSDSRAMVAMPGVPGGESSAPVLFWNDTAIVLYVDAGVALLQPVAEPQHASGPMLPGDPGNTNAYPETLDLTQSFTAEPLGDGSVRVLRMVVIDDTLIYMGAPISSSLPLNVNEQILGSIDIPTGEEAWRFVHPGGDMWPIHVATDGEHVYATLDNVTAGTFRVVSIDSSTGEIRWESADLHEVAGHDLEPYVGPGEPVIVGETVLISYGPESLLALDSSTGEAQWTLVTSEDKDTNPERNPMPTASVVANHDTVFRSLPSGAFQEINIETGKILAETPNPEERWPLTRTSLHLSGDYLIVRRGYIPGDVPEYSRIDVYNIATGQGIWTTSIDRYLGDILVTDDTLVVPGSLWKEPSLFERIIPFIDYVPTSEVSVLSFDLKTGEVLDLFSDEDFENFPNLSASGNTICMSAYAVRCIDRDGTEMSVEGYEVEQYMSFNPPVYWNGHIIIGNGMGPIMIALPESMPIASPASSSVERNAVAARLTTGSVNTFGHPAEDPHADSGGKGTGSPQGRT